MLLEKAHSLDNSYLPATSALINYYTINRNCKKAQGYVLEKRSVDDIGYNLVLGRLYSCLNKKALAKLAYSKVLKNDPENIHALYNLGYLYLSQYKNYDMALKQYKKIILKHKTTGLDKMLDVGKVKHFVAIIEKTLRLKSGKKEKRKGKGKITNESL